MFAFIQNSQIANVVDAVPEGANPANYLPIVNDSLPPLTTAFSSVVERPVTEWAIGGSQVTRTFSEYIPSLADCKAIKKARDRIASSTSAAAGISVTLAPYGTMTFPPDAVLDMLACSTLCDYEMRGNASAGEADVSFVTASGEVVAVKSKDAGRVVRDYLSAYRTNRLALQASINAAENASTIGDLL